VITFASRRTLSAVSTPFPCPEDPPVQTAERGISTHPPSESRLLRAASSAFTLSEAWGSLPQSRPAGAPSPATDVRIVGRSSGRTLVFVMSSDVWAFEARGRLVLVHAEQGSFDIDLPLVEVESVLGPRFCRVHRNWLVGLSKVRELWSGNGTMHLFAGMALSGESAVRRGIEVPVARDRVKRVRRELLADTFGLRPAARCG
jgi:DNA-binding LytR/AlgR family response regulator